ncbi:hypothetical protein SDC9_78166 [bioreactor metagenome]|uniref:Uncharacterized protein n=1 Tax=bioreactor metagenome TaxID=1076179 RepID=A0A644YSS8_9ZZZZ
MPQAPPSPALEPTVTGASSAAARIRCPTPSVRKKPPWPYIDVIRTPSAVSTSMPSRSVPSMPKSWARMKLARLSVLSGVRTTIGRPSASPTLCSPDRKLYASRPPPSASPASAARNSVPKTCDGSVLTPSAVANSPNTPAQA